MHLSRLNTQEALKLSLTPKSYNEQPFPFYIGISPRALNLPLIRNECCLIPWQVGLVYSAYFTLKMYT